MQSQNRDADDGYTCWFCGRRNALFDVGYVARLQKLTRNGWRQPSVMVPRCEVCNARHRQPWLVQKLVWVLGALALVAAVFLRFDISPREVAILALGVFAGGFVARALWLVVNRARGTRPLSAWKDYDEVKSLLEAGFYRSRNVI